MTSLTEQILAARDIVSNAYDHEEEYIKLNETIFTPLEMGAALNTLLTLGMASDALSFEWRQSRCLTMNRS